MKNNKKKNSVAKSKIENSQFTVGRGIDTLKSNFDGVRDIASTLPEEHRQKILGWADKAYLETSKVFLETTVNSPGVASAAIGS